jgi:hypothetical protein
LTVLLAPPGIGEVGPVIVEDDLLDNTLNSPLLVEGGPIPDVHRQCGQAHLAGREGGAARQ